MSRIEKLLTGVAIVLGMILVEVTQWGNFTWEELSLPWHPRVSMTTAAFLAPIALLVLVTAAIEVLGLLIALLKGMKSEFVALVHTPKQHKIQLAANFGLCSWILKLAIVGGDVSVYDAWIMSLATNGMAVTLIFFLMSISRAFRAETN